jgi:Tfp pilus assembly protein PilO
MSSLKLDLSARAVALAVMAAALALAGGAWMTVVSPKHAKAAKLAGSIQADKQRLESAKRQLATQEKAAKAKRAQLSTLEAALPDTIAMPEVVDELNALARHADVTLDSITPSTAILGTGYEAVPISVVVDGRFFAVERFLHLIRDEVQLNKQSVKANGRLVDVKSVDLEQTEPAPNVTATISMQVFYFAPSIAPPPVATSTTDTATTPSS